ncbi:GntR family transcriptional regulator [Nonomuraea sp. NPDC050383]|uniref:GntR family transcriptional regulator n=1 Tax=Nonomuraea sp. NPDC050383 TaxID=3364362 RepID=UPI0037993A26
MAGEVEVPEWDPDATRVVYVYEALADHIALRIEAGHWKPGNPLPGERALSEEYGVALGTIRRGLDVLRERGLVVTLKSKGTLVKPQESPSGQE